MDVSAKSADGVEELFQKAARIGVPNATERLEESTVNSVSLVCLLDHLIINFKSLKHNKYILTLFRVLLKS